ncbi:MAG: hypothetical protein OFPII_14310 [Osedax symbiont Rs1]|nr:MAG: hypothetical protein OFPII_14310 [Osedax symbiont Rs1]
MNSFAASASLEKTVEQYLNYLQKERQLALHSVLNYQSDLYAFRDFIADYRVQHWQHVTAKQVQAFIGNAQIQEKSVATILRLLSAVQGFINFLRQVQILDFDPLLGFEKPTLITQNKRPADSTEPIALQALLNVQVRDFVTARDRAMLEVLLHTGIRVSELCGLELYAIDFGAKQLSVSLKGNRRGANQRQLPIVASVETALRQWLDYRQQTPVFDAALFVSRRGKRLTVRGIQRRIDCHSDGRVTASQIRQAFSQQLLAANYSVPQMMKMMGTSSVVAAANQPALGGDKEAMQDLMDCYQSAHPRAAKSPKS